MSEEKSESATAALKPMRNSDQRTCSTCRWWHLQECRRFPPSVVPYAADNRSDTTYWPATWFPQTHETTWCGEWTAFPTKEETP